MNSKKTSTPETSPKEEPKVTKPSSSLKKTGPSKAPPKKSPKVVRKPSVAKVRKPSVAKIPRVTIQSLPVGARFEYEGSLFRKALPVDKTNQIGQRLVKAQFSDTLLLGTAKSFPSKTLVVPK